MKIGIYSNGFNYSYDDLKRLWITVDRSGFDIGVIPDNSTNGLRGYSLQPNWDAWTMLPALAEVTDTMRLGPICSPVLRRPPQVLAKMSSCFDVMSEGRLVLGMGASDYPQFWLPWGMDFPTAKVRIARLAEEIQVVKRMWTEDRANFDGEYYRLMDAINMPKPVQDPRPPIWLGVVEGRRLMPDVVARHADGIAMVSHNDEDLNERLDDLTAACSRNGRDYDEITKVQMVYVTLTDDASYTYRDGIARHGTEMQLGAQVTQRYIEAADTGSYRIVGTTELVNEVLAKLQRRGIDQILVHFSSTEAPIGGAVDAVIEDVEVFAREVIPNFEEA